MRLALFDAVYCWYIDNVFTEKEYAVWISFALAGCIKYLFTPLYDNRPQYEFILLIRTDFHKDQSAYGFKFKILVSKLCF